MSANQCRGRSHERGAIGPLESRALLSDPAGSAAALFHDLNDERYAEYGDAIAMRGRLYFLANTSRGAALWATNGTPKGTTIIQSLPEGRYRPSNPARDMASAGGRLYFSLEGRGRNEPATLWRTDGTTEGTTLVKELDGPLRDMVALRTRLLFTVGQKQEGSAFWLTNGSRGGTRQLKLKQPLQYVDYLTPIRGRVVFRAKTEGAPMDVWQTDGTRKGTRPLHAPVSSHMAPHTFVRSGRNLLYIANTPHSNRLFATDLKTHRLVEQIDPLGNARLEPFAGNDSYVLFRTHRNGRNHLWRVDARSGNALRLRRLEDASFAHQIAHQQTESGLTFFNDGDALWRSDGTAAGTYVLRRGRNELFRALPAVGDTLFFARATDAAGWELWSSDGTRAGTRRVIDLRPGSDGGFRNAMGVVRGRAIFRGNNPAADGDEAIFASDGTARGTRRLTSLADRTRSSHAQGFTPVGDHLFYVTPHGAGCCLIRGPALWKTSASGEHQQHLASFPGDVVTDLVPLTHGVLFHTYPFSLASIDGEATWISDGTPAGTRRLTDSYADGAAIGGRYVFYQYRLEEPRIWTTDGEDERGVPIGELFPGGTNVPEIEAAGGKIVFSVKVGDRYQIWTTAPDLSRLTFLAEAPGPALRAVAGDAAIYLLVKVAPHQYALWSTDGTPAGTRPRVTGLTQPPSMAALGDRLYYTASDPEHGQELRALAGDGQRLVKDVRPGPAGSGVVHLLAAQGRLYFRADDGEHGAELWTSDGTAAGTSLVADVRPGPLGGLAGHPYPAVGSLFFSGDDRVHGQEPWRSDGSEARTVLVGDLATGPAGSEPGDWRLFNDKLIFSADDQVHGREPWFVPLGDERVGE